MDAPLCTGCRQRDAALAGLQARLADLEAAVAHQQQTIQRLEATVHGLTERLAQYESEAGREGSPGLAPAEKPSASYSLDAERQRRRRRRRRKKSPGRRPTELKFAAAERFQ